MNMVWAPTIRTIGTLRKRFYYGNYTNLYIEFHELLQLIPRTSCVCAWLHASSLVLAASSGLGR